VELTLILLWIGAVIFIIAGIAGLFVPAIPGPTFLLLGLIFASWAEDFIYIGWGTISGLVVLTALAFLIDFMAGALGAKKSGASRRATLGALIGAIVGLFFGIIGIFVGPFIGAFLGELSVRKRSTQAAQVGINVLIGIIIGAAAKVAIGFAMIGLYVIVRYF
jgi:uncharacterized protein YqgC (DUF456 family)